MTDWMVPAGDSSCQALRSNCHREWSEATAKASAPPEASAPPLTDRTVPAGDSTVQPAAACRHRDASVPRAKTTSFGEAERASIVPAGDRSDQPATVWTHSESSEARANTSLRPEASLLALIARIVPAGDSSTHWPSLGFCPHSEWSVSVVNTRDGEEASADDPPVEALSRPAPPRPDWRSAIRAR